MATYLVKRFLATPGASGEQLIADMSQYLVQVKPDRANVRNLHPTSFVPFNYRVAWNFNLFLYCTKKRLVFTAKVNSAKISTSDRTDVKMEPKYSGVAIVPLRCVISLLCQQVILTPWKLGAKHGLGNSSHLRWWMMRQIFSMEKICSGKNYLIEHWKAETDCFSLF